MIITLGGSEGSGKTTVAKMLAKQLNYKFHSMGNIWREIANSRNMTFEEFHKQADTNPEHDKLVDDFLKELGKKDNLILDSRLAWFFIPNSFKIWVDCDDEIRAKRIFNAKRQEEKFDTPDALKIRNAERTRENINRFKKLYNIEDYTKKENYDFIIDTTNISAEEAAELILGEIEKA